MRNIKFIIFFIIGFYSNIRGQILAEKKIGFTVGFVGAIGTHFQRFGFVFQGYAVSGFAQLNGSFRVYENFRNLGPRGEHTEFSSSLGFCMGYGEIIKEKNLIISSISNQTGYKNSFAYSYNLYLNRIKTTQVTGTIAFQFYRISIITENDLLAKPALDRFRTGAFLVQYQTQHFQYAVNCTMWTGKLGETVKNDSLFPGKGYINTVGGVHQNLSHGLLSAQIKYSNHFGQYLQANAGVDAEQVRDIVQNKFLHGIIPGNYNMPMIDTTGNQYLYRKDQKIRKPKMLLNAYTSPNIFY
ncbi:MAG: polymorphic toxin type 23 domain-containing protein [Bacteroidota bacterium]